MAIRPDGHHIVSGGGDKAQRVWNAEEGRELARGLNDVAPQILAPSLAEGDPRPLVYTDDQGRSTGSVHSAQPTKC